MKLIEIKDNEEIYTNEDIKRIISFTMFRPSVGRIKSIAQSLYSKQQGLFYTAVEDEKIVGIIGVKRVDNLRLEIFHHAVDENMRKQGIGRRMIEELALIAEVDAITAEVEYKPTKFYEKCGFKCELMDDKGLGIELFLCTLAL